MAETKAAPELEREDYGDVTVLRVLAPMLTAQEAADGVFDYACSLVDAEGRSRLVLDLQKVGYMASAAIGKLVALMRKAAAAGGKLVLCKTGRAVEEVLRLCRLSDILPSYTDEQEARRALVAFGSSSR
ncbi:MAG TPA: STAS domain-containing protein [Gemmataceae bacterium]|nr:STAS domain-containing protein [Gemmataceae bacterium]